MISLGIYRFIAYIFLLLLKNIRFIRKFFLDPKYLEGTWVGFYIGSNNQVKFIVERFEQDLEILRIRGTAYNDQKRFHTS
ncbi:hypothetical protein C8N46_10954 [Kordia periserrulae]|uniref:Uncharacterized protein n=1 Tax=Kordia periserrulae TaxID=701523 RepID=A0A2T6BTV3_9FLAO|nr:hypothetical protein C8N46_10954 [Kordia periserrulae]